MKTALTAEHPTVIHAVDQKVSPLKGLVIDAGPSDHETGVHHKPSANREFHMAQ